MALEAVLHGLWQDAALVQLLPMSQRPKTVRLVTAEPRRELGIAVRVAGMTGKANADARHLLMNLRPKLVRMAISAPRPERGIHLPAVGMTGKANAVWIAVLLKPSGTVLAVFVRRELSMHLLPILAVRPQPHRRIIIVGKRKFLMSGRIMRWNIKKIPMMYLGGVKN